MGLLNIFQKKNPSEDYEDSLKNKKVWKLFGEITLLLIADTHGDLTFDKEMQKKLAKWRFDLCCVLGDVTEGDYKVILSYIPRHKIVCLLGNHDNKNLLSTLGLYNLNGRIIKKNDFLIGGIEGSFRYKNGEFPSFTHEESIEFLSKMSPVDILLSHDKPFTVDRGDDTKDGLKGITKYIYENKVPLNIHGHIHVRGEEKLKNGTLVETIYGVELMKIEEGKVTRTYE